MRLKIFPWLGQQFISLSWEGNGEGTVEDETRDLFARFAERWQHGGMITARTGCSSATWTAGMPGPRARRDPVEQGRSGELKPHLAGSHRRQARITVDLRTSAFPDAKVFKELTRPPSCFGG